MRNFRLIGALAVVGSLGGCASTGLLEQPGVSETFSVSADYQAAYRRAGEYVRVCHETRAHRYGVVYTSHRELGVRDAPNRIQVVNRAEPAKVLEIIRSEMDGPSASKVTVTVLGGAPWDQAEIDAARKSIQSATPVCRPEE